MAFSNLPTDFEEALKEVKMWREKYRTQRPQAREPLTEVQIATVYWGATGQSLRPQDNALAHIFARAIEAAHGITGVKK